MARKPPDKGRPPKPTDRVVVLHGKEIFLREQYTAELRAGLEKEHGEVEVVRFAGSECSAAEVLDECRSFGLMSSYKLVVVDDAEQLVQADTRPLFERYAEQPSEQATLVLRGDTWRKGNLDKAINAVGVITACDHVSESTALRWLDRRAGHAHGATLERDAASLLVEKLGTDLARLDSELGKLATNAAGRGAGGGDTPIITRAAVVELVGGTREEVAWTVQSQLLTGSAERAIAQMRTVQAGNKSDMTVPLMWACVDLARKLSVAASGLEAREPPQALAKSLRLWGPAQDAVFHAARRLGPERARRLYRTTLDADAGSKSGLGTAENTLERLAVEYQLALHSAG
ncbi:MAG: DNA polymerase III subunit delta [Phycisphaerales bacterium JB037]